jgi:hypothetical protein
MKVYLTILFLSLLLFACEKDEPCDDINCLNGASCVDGACICQEGFSGPNCELFDPCYDLNCLNGGSCENGKCDCETGYSGENCELQITPRLIRFTKIVMENWPATDSGSTWDGNLCGNPNPDIFLTLEDEGGVFLTTTHQTDCVSGLSYGYAQAEGLPVLSAYLDNFLVLRLFDYDEGSCAPPDFMGGLFGPMYDSTNNFPEKLRFRNSTAQIDVTFLVEYEF